MLGCAFRPLHLHLCLLPGSPCANTMHLTHRTWSQIPSHNASQRFSMTELSTAQSRGHYLLRDVYNWSLLQSCSSSFHMSLSHKNVLRVSGLYLWSLLLKKNWHREGWKCSLAMWQCDFWQNKPESQDTLESERWLLLDPQVQRTQLEITVKEQHALLPPIVQPCDGHNGKALELPLFLL